MVSFRMTTNVDTIKMPITRRLRASIDPGATTVRPIGTVSIWAVSGMAIPGAWYGWMAHDVVQALAGAPLPKYSAF
jgi:hypothetical protein